MIHGKVPPLTSSRLHCSSVSDDSFANVIETVDKQGDIVKVLFKL